MERPQKRLASWRGALAGLVVLGGTALALPASTSSGALRAPFGVLAGLAVAGAVWARRPHRPAPWLLLAAGALSLGLGDVWFAAGGSSLGVSAGDLLHVAGLVLMALTLGTLVGVGRGAGRAARMLFVDAAAVLAAATTGLWFFVYEMRFDVSNASASTRFGVMAFPTLDLLLLALAARLALTGAVRIASYRLLAAGVAIAGVDDLLSRGLGTPDYRAPWIWGGYAAGYLMLAAAALHPSMRELSEVRVPEQDTLTRLRAVFLGCSSAVVPAVLIVRHAELRGDLNDFIGLALAATIIPLLVGYRLVDLARIARSTAAALQSSEELYRHVVEGSPSLICLLDTEARVVYMSPAAEALTGYTSAEAEGQTVWSLLRPDDPQALVDGFPAAAGGGPMERTTIHAKTKTGDDLYLDGSVALVQGYGDRKGDLILAIAHDATKEVQAAASNAELEQRLQQAEKMEAIGQLAGGIAHDFNNLLLAIRGYGELAVLGLQTHDLGAAEQDIGEMLLAADRATDLTRQLLAFGRRQVLMPELLDLNDLICDTAGMLGPLLDAPIELRVLPADGPVLVRADRGQLTQVITNLAINARDAMPDGGTLTMTTAVTDTEALLTVADDGVGMSGETAVQIFEPFFTTKAHTGTGLGLATVQGIVDQSGGTIGVETEPGKGARFTIRLPRVREEPAFDAEVAATTLEDPSTGTVLLIEDTAVVRAVVRAFLESDGYHILEAERGEDALALARAYSGPIDIVLTDIVLPGMDGTQAAAEVSAERPDVKVPYMSGYTNDPELQAGRLRAGTAFIQKPFTGGQLHDALHSLAVDG